MRSPSMPRRTTSMPSSETPAWREAGLGECSQCVGQLNTRDEVRLTRNAQPVFTGKRDHLQRLWSETSWRMQTLRDNPESARQEYDRIIDPGDPGLSVSLSFDPKEIFVIAKSRPRVAILREQGVNGQVEMAAAFERSGLHAGG